MFFSKSFSLNHYTESVVKNLILMNAIMIMSVLSIHASVIIHASEKLYLAKYIILTCVFIFAIINNFDIKINVNKNNKNKWLVYDYEFNNYDVHIEEIENAV